MDPDPAGVSQIFEINVPAVTTSVLLVSSLVTLPVSVVAKETVLFSEVVAGAPD